VEADFSWRRHITTLNGVYVNILMVTELQEAFMLFDYNKSGMIYARDIGPVVRSVGLKPSQAEIRSIMADVQQSGMVMPFHFP